MHAGLQALEARTALLVEGHDLTVEHRSPRPHLTTQLAQLRVLPGDVAQGATLEADTASLDVGDRPHAVPLDLESVVLVVARQIGEARHHRHDVLGHRVLARIGGRVHAVDHPVFALRLEEHVLALQALAVEHRDHLVVAPLLGLVRALVPDLHRPGAVLALGNLTGEVDVLERVVLDVHGEVIALGVHRDALRDRPRRQHAVALQAQVPVQVAGVVLMDHEPVGGLALATLPGRLRGLPEVPLAFVFTQLLSHPPAFGFT